MTITLTNAEALEILTAYWQDRMKLDVAPVVVIGATRDDLACQLTQAVGELRPDNKIQCIKNLRTAVQDIPELKCPTILGLAEKYAKQVDVTPERRFTGLDGYNNGLR